MANVTFPDLKARALRSHGALNLRPEGVTASEFSHSDFFDPRDLVQIKYELLRLVQVNGVSVSHATRRFGLSRPTYYAAKAEFERDGLMGLLPQKRGPRHAYKFNEEVMVFLGSLSEAEPQLTSTQLATHIEDRFEKRVHPRSVERALERWKKNRR